MHLLGYAFISDDETIINPNLIDAVPYNAKNEIFNGVNAMIEIGNALEVFDSTNIKIVINEENILLYAIRSLIPCLS